MKGIYDRLKAYGKSDFYPFHMPGHKRNSKCGPLSELYRLDITEIDGFDDLHHPVSIIKEAQERAAQLYHSEHTYFLIDGSTAGILTAISAVSGRGRKLILARNCHKAVYHAAFLNHLELCYVYPELLKGHGIAGEIRAQDIENQIKAILSEEEGKEPKELICGVVITSPTYDGVSSDVQEIADMVHRYDLPLIVDQAHGAHFGFHPAFPENAVAQGADAVIHSVHKTLPAPTQTALLHINGDLIGRNEVEKYLHIYQSSSPSYVLMAGIDESIAFVKKRGYEGLDKVVKFRRKLEDTAAALNNLKLCPGTEPGKALIYDQSGRMSGQELMERLEKKYHLQMEMASGAYVTAILTMADQKAGIRRLWKALCELDQFIEKLSFRERTEEVIFRAQKKLPMWQAYEATYDEVDIYSAAGRIAAEFVGLYPPGIPLLVPGEVIPKEILDMESIVKKYEKIKVVAPQK